MWVEVFNEAEYGIYKCELKDETDTTHEIPFDKWALWKDKYGNVEMCRLKMDAYDHFFPTPKIIKNENDLVAFWIEEEK